MFTVHFGIPLFLESAIYQAQRVWYFQDADGSGTLGLPELVQGVTTGKLHVTVMGTCELKELKPLHNFHNKFGCGRILPFLDQTLHFLGYIKRFKEFQIFGSSLAIVLILFNLRKLRWYCLCPKCHLNQVFWRFVVRSTRAIRSPRLFDGRVSGRFLVVFAFGSWGRLKKGVLVRLFFDACTRYWFIYLDDDMMYGDCMVPILHAHVSPFVHWMDILRMLYRSDL